jgi:hypothetical protein
MSGAAAFVKTVKGCDAGYAANKEAIKASGQKKADYVTACRAGATAPVATPAAPASPASAPVAPAIPTAAPAPVITPTPKATAAAKPASAPAKPAAATGTGGFATDAQARAHCPADTVVWVNTKSHVYHFAGTHNYGTTESPTRNSGVVV